MQVDKKSPTPANCWSMPRYCKDPYTPNLAEEQSGQSYYSEELQTLEVQEEAEQRSQRLLDTNLASCY
jgi:hypothetical protein